MKKMLMLLCAVMTGLCIVGSASAFMIDFEDGMEGQAVNNIAGVTFEAFNGSDSMYGDSRTNKYSTTSDDLGYGNGMFHHNGNMWLWAGTGADARGVIVDFTNNDGTWFQTGYSSMSSFYVEAHLTDGSTVVVTGGSNTHGPMDFLRVDATSGIFIDYVVLHDSGNMWLVDDMSGDASAVGNAVPEPSPILLVGIGLLGVMGYGRMRSRMR
ncbi:MAG: PEP-CTERM sorting domain-containing protein [Desulfobacteraceae bacterium]|nr:PEP-CTERM sorting domain-containing protein [Desulfobacteraceae bacterium]